MSKYWQWSPAPPHITLETLFRTEGKFCFLAGSGISVDPPSNLPTGYQFTQAVLERLIPLQRRTEIINLTNPNRRGMRNSNDFLRFEQLIEYLQRWFDPQLRILKCFAECQTPNLNHLFLAQMILGGHTVFTTNFDNLIEYALMEVGIPRKKVYPAIIEEDWISRPKSKQYRVYKPHGSLIDAHSGKGIRESFERTLAKIEKFRGEIFQLEHWKRDVLQSVLQDRDLVILGYCGVGDFDILPSLWNIRSDKRVIWINHDSRLSPTHTQIEVLKSSFSPSFGSHLDPVDQHLRAFAQYKTRSASELIHIRVNTNQLLRWLWTQLIQTPLPGGSLMSSKEGAFSLDEDIFLTEAEQWLLTGKIFADLNFPAESMQAYQNVLRYSLDSKNQKYQQISLHAVGKLLQSQELFKEALETYEQALTRADQMKDRQEKLELLIAISDLLQDQGFFEKALETYNQALAIAKQLNNVRERAVILNKIGQVFYCQKNLEESLKKYQQALALYKRQKDPLGQAHTLNNLGNLFYSQKRSDEALSAYQQSLTIADQLGDLRSKIRQISNISQLLYTQNRLNEALKYYQKGLLIAEQLGDPLEKIRILNSMGKVFHRQANSDEALNYFQQALSIAEDAKILWGKAWSLNSMGWLLHSQNRREMALRYYHDAFDIFSKLGSHLEKAWVLNNTGELFCSQGHNQEALKLFRQALIIATQLNDPNLLEKIETNIERIEK
ncbi:MAG: tetratricopeptide repeat protein [Candidatus Hodarchaeota archaeon]